MKRGVRMRRGQALVVLFGLWLALSPWIAGYAQHAHAVQDSIVGVLVLLAGLTSAAVGLMTAVPMWIAFALGIWVFFTPIVFEQVGPSFSADNDLIVGMLIAVSASIAVVSRARALLLAGPADPAAARGQTSLE
jgi:hypothetical protein